MCLPETTLKLGEKYGEKKDNSFGSSDDEEGREENYDAKHL
jgi:hypothetical protein